MDEELKIAVYLDHSNHSTALSKPGAVKVFTKGPAGWIPGEELAFDPSSISSIKELRESFVQIVRALEFHACGIFAAAEIRGIPLTILENLKFSIWEVYGTPEEFLDTIADRVIIEKSDNTHIIDNGDGCYFVDLKAVMDKSEKLSSKQLLLPFFKETEFKLLRIACSHIPPWFEQELAKMHLQEEVEQLTDGSFVVNITPQ